MSIELPDPPRVVKLSSIETNKLLTDPDWSENGEIFQHLKFAKGYVHKDGRVLKLFVSGNGNLYESVDDVYRDHMRFEMLRAASRHMLQDNFPYGDDFPQHVQELIDLLSTHLKIPREELNGSWESLTKLEKAVEKYGTRKSLEFPVFPGLLAYSGEIMLRETNGRWLMQLDERSGVWEPWVMGANGYRMQVFIALYKMLYEEPFVSIAGTIAIAINVPPFNKHLIKKE
jgi:hypothetical protein